MKAEDFNPKYREQIERQLAAPQKKTNPNPLGLDVEKINSRHLELKSLKSVGDEFGVNGVTVWRQLKKNGKELIYTRYSNKEVEFVKKLYTSGVPVDLLEASNLLGRSPKSISAKAVQLGIASKAGYYKRTEKAKENIKMAKKLEWENDDFRLRQLKSRYGMYRAHGHATGKWKAGWREFGGVRKFYRSRWESNYARYLEFQKSQKLIKSWEHECETFWFEGIRRGCVSYLPDFKVTKNDGTVEYHEVKGWMDDRSKVKIKRMAQYHPDVVLIIINEKSYKAIERTMSKIIPNWE